MLGDALLHQPNAPGILNDLDLYSPRLKQGLVAMHRRR